MKNKLWQEKRKSAEEFIEFLEGSFELSLKYTDLSNKDICNKISPIGRGTSFDSSSLDPMRTEVRTFLIRVFAGFPKIKFSMEKARMVHDARNKQKSAFASCPLAVSVDVWRVS